MASSKSAWKFSGAFFFFILLILAFSSACSSSGAQGNRGGGPNSNTEAEEAPIAVTTVRTEAREVPAVVQTTGSLVADETSNVAPKVAGKVVNVGIDVGDFIGQGSVIAKIDAALNGNH